MCTHSCNRGPFLIVLNKKEISGFTQSPEWGWAPSWLPCSAVSSGSLLSMWWLLSQSLVDLSPAACTGLCFSFTSSGRGTGACAQQALRFSLVGTCSWLEQRGHQSLYVPIRSTGLSLIGSRSLWNMVMVGGAVLGGVGNVGSLGRTGESSPVLWAARPEPPVGPALLLSCC